MYQEAKRLDGGLARARGHEDHQPIDLTLLDHLQVVAQQLLVVRGFFLREQFLAAAVVYEFGSLLVAPIFVEDLDELSFVLGRGRAQQVL